ncbi:MAG: tRNA (adenosine(37)-N6)-threonylcarbamoyltransferase complex ATPase subunit type 1 TsaE [Candidatus Magasanikbacteria bacterium]|nr:tRNA (adenosine(37)-N6)-threonylcarbamoyltransferase complex ATPase subunit type 1 TsaE [Candidatus Magasanikbacteria bacterium]
MISITNTAKQTFNLGKKTAASLCGGDILTLSGELGAGKTVFIKGLAVCFGIKQTVRSPSFNLMKIYNLPKTKKIKHFVHLDCYRLKSAQEVIDIGLLEHLGAPNTVCAVEWPEKIAPLIKKFKTQKIKISILKNNQRKIVMK